MSPEQNLRVVVATTGDAGEYLATLLMRSGWWVSRAPSDSAALVLAATTSAQIVLLDADQVDEVATTRFVAAQADAAVVLFGRGATPHLAVRVGAASVVPRPFEATDAIERIARAVAHVARRDSAADGGRVRVTIARLVREADAARRAGDWAGVLARAETVLALDPQDTTARALHDSARTALLQEALGSEVAQARWEPVDSPGRPSLDWAVARSIALLPLPAIASRIIETVNDPTASSDTLARLVQSDPALTTEVLRAANSAHYARLSRSATVREALVVLGTNELRALAFAACFARTANRTNVVSLPDFWAFSLAVGLLADVLARTMGIGQEFAYTAGVIHNIGLLALDLSYPAELRAAVALQEPGLRRLHDRQRAVLGFTDAELGARLGETWGFPVHLVKVMEQHRLRQDELTEGDFLVDYVIRARILARSQGMNDGIEESAPREIPVEWSVPPLSVAFRAIGGIEGIRARLAPFASHS